MCFYTQKKLRFFLAVRRFKKNWGKGSPGVKNTRFKTQPLALAGQRPTQSGPYSLLYKKKLKEFLRCHKNTFQDSYI